MKRNKVIIFIIIIIGLLIDQVTKIIAINKGINLEPAENNSYHILITIIAIILIIRYISRDNSYIKLDTKIILSFGITGAIGNLIDRILKGYVIVFLNMGHSIIINLAYIYIAIAWVGMALILTKNSFKIFKGEEHGSKKNNNKWRIRK